MKRGSRGMKHAVTRSKVLSPPAQLSVTVFITPRLHRPYQGSLANNASLKHLTFPNSGILTKFQGGVTQGPLHVLGSGFWKPVSRYRRRYRNDLIQVILWRRVGSYYYISLSISSLIRLNLCLSTTNSQQTDIQGIPLTKIGYFNRANTCV